MLWVGNPCSLDKSIRGCMPSITCTWKRVTIWRRCRQEKRWKPVSQRATFCVLSLRARPSWRCSRFSLLNETVTCWTVVVVVGLQRKRRSTRFLFSAPKNLMRCDLLNTVCGLFCWDCGSSSSLSSSTHGGCWNCRVCVGNSGETGRWILTCGTCIGIEVGNRGFVSFKMSSIYFN